jgi:hypothetical protein
MINNQISELGLSSEDSYAYSSELCPEFAGDTTNLLAVLSLGVCTFFATTTGCFDSLALRLVLYSFLSPEPFPSVLTTTF